MTTHRKIPVRSILTLTGLAVLLLSTSFMGGCSDSLLDPPSNVDSGSAARTKDASHLGNGIVVFQAQRGGQTDIFVIRDDGTGEVNITNDGATENGAAISPDGTRVAYASDRDGRHSVYIAVIDPTSLMVTTTTELVTGTSDWSGYHAIDWAPDGSHLLVEARRNDVHVVDRVDIATGASELALPTSVNGTTMDAHRPQYNADGTMIYVFRNPPYNGFAGDVYRHDADGTDAVRLTELPGVQTWSPAEIVVGGEPHFLFTHYTTTHSGQIYLGSPDGTLQNISNNAYDDRDTKLPSGPNAAAFDGWFVFHSYRDGMTNVFLRTLDGSQEIPLTTAGGVRPDWWAGEPAAEPVAAAITFHPESLNVAANGNFVTVYVDSDGAWDVTGLEEDSIRLAGELGAVRSPRFEDVDGDGADEMVLKFGRSAVAALLPLGDSVAVSFTGTLIDGTPVYGEDLIRVFVPAGLGAVGRNHDR